MCKNRLPSSSKSPKAFSTRNPSVTSSFSTRTKNVFIASKTLSTEIQKSCRKVDIRRQQLRRHVDNAKRRKWSSITQTWSKVSRRQVDKMSNSEKQNFAYLENNRTTAEAAIIQADEELCRQMCRWKQMWVKRRKTSTNWSTVVTCCSRLWFDDRVNRCRPMQLLEVSNKNVLKILKFSQIRLHLTTRKSFCRTIVSTILSTKEILSNGSQLRFVKYWNCLM